MMKKQLIKIIAPLFALLIITSLIVFPAPVTAKATTDQEKATDFMKKMLPVDLSKYTINIRSDSTLEGFPLGDSNRKIHNILYELTSENSKVHIGFAFEKGVMTSCFLSELEGQAITNKQYTNALDAARDFLERYQVYANMDSSNLIAMLNNVDVTKDSTIIIGNTKLDIKSTYIGEKDQTSFIWSHVINGADYPIGVGLTFDKDGTFMDMGDSRTLYTLGDTSINVSLEQAIDIAIEHLQSYSYEMPDGSIVKDFKVNKNTVMAELVVGPVDFVDYVLRPYWDVRLYLDEPAPGSVFGITVFIWANTGEIISYGNMASGGINYPNNTNHANNTATPPNSNTLIVGIVIVAVIAVVTAGILVTKKKQK